MSLLAELHDVRRFPSAPALMAYLGLCRRARCSRRRREWAGFLWAALQSETART